jgi:hypothetical protein
MKPFIESEIERLETALNALKTMKSKLSALRELPETKQADTKSLPRVRKYQSRNPERVGYRRSFRNILLNNLFLIILP